MNGRTVPGSTYLTPEQREWYRTKFGVRYLVVEQDPYRGSRKARRNTKRKDVG